MCCVVLKSYTVCIVLFIAVGSSVIASSKTSPVSFSLSQLKMVRETARREGTRLTFFLRDGKELPTLSFHDGGTAGLLQSMQRFLYLVRYIHVHVQCTRSWDFLIFLLTI